MKIRKCLICEVYTLREKCPACSFKTIIARPARFSPQDPYGKYRRRMKREMGEDAH